MHVDTTHAITLYLKPYREHDALVWFYTREAGQLQAVVNRCKKPNSLLASATVPLTANIIGTSGRQSLKSLNHAQRIQSFATLHSDIERLAAASVCADLMKVLGQAHESDSAATYDFFLNTLHAFDDASLPWASVSLQCQKSFLDMAGFGVDWHHCVHCGTDLPTQAYPHLPFSLSVGGLLCPECIQMGLDRVNVSTQTIRLIQDPTNTDVWPQILKAHKLMDYIWQHQIGKPLKSMGFLLHLLETDQSTKNPDAASA